MRVPAIARWPGVVKPMTTVRALTSSLDWMPTFAALAGYRLDTSKGVIYDGWDMSALLFTTAGQLADTGRRDRYFYHTSAGGSAELVAVRLGPYKLHLITEGWACEPDYPDKTCCSNQPEGKRASPPGGILFNVERDLSEVLPLSAASHEYKKWAPVLFSMAAEYLKTYSVTTSQMKRGSSNDRFPCCSPGCTPLPECCTCGAK